MTKDTSYIDDEILRRILIRDGTTSTEAHDEDLLEDISLLAEGQLSATEAEQLFAHLADRPSLRQALSSQLLEFEEPKNIVRLGTAIPVPRRLAVLALAASLLVALGVLLWPTVGDHMLAEATIYQQGLDMLESSKFNELNKLLSDAKSNRIHSARLGNLQTQSVLQVPAEVSLASLGRLSDFGYHIDGSIARSVDDADTLQPHKSAYETLTLESDQIEVIQLNKAFLLLRMNELNKARIGFGRLTETSPRNPYGWLGLGIAAYSLEDFTSAATAFEEAIRLDSSIVSVHENLAMTYTELGEFAAAIEAWNSVLALHLNPTEADQIRQQVDQLRDQLSHSPRD